MVQVLLDCEINAQCVSWLEELLEEEQGSRRIVEKFLELMGNALQKKIEDLVGNSSPEKLTVLQVCDKVRSTVKRELSMLQMNNHGTDFAKTFLKVIWHQLQENDRKASDSTTDQLSQFHEETLLCSYIKDIHVEMVQESDLGRLAIKGTHSTQLEDVIHGILCDREGALSVESHSNSSKGALNLQSEALSFQVRFYINLEDRQASLEACISQGFDNIGISDSASDSEATLADATLEKLPVKLENLKNVKLVLLPSRNLDNLWETLHYDSNLKQQLFSHAMLSLQLSSKLKKFNNIFSSNNLFLLHGPPGTGKTTLCKALCQKLALRQWNIFDGGYSGVLIELSCSKIFSRWFGESTKNLDGIFSDIEMLLKSHSDTGKFVFLLFDEVESLALSRDQLLDKNETTDSLRVINCLMTHLDHVKKYPNFILLCTSNLKNNIDPAFLDRLDVSFFVDFPSITVCFEILRSITHQLIRSEIVCIDENEFRIDPVIQVLASFSNRAKISGRSLSKLPLCSISEHFTALPVPLTEYLLAMCSGLKKMSHSDATCS